MGSMDLQQPAICLASVSPRRRELLTQIGVPHKVVGAHIDETAHPGEMPRDYVLRMARQKAVAVRNRGEALPVLAADTTVVLDHVIYGKPRDRDDGIAMLQRLSDRTHEVLTAVAIADAREVALRLNVSTVRFRSLTLEECIAYWNTGEPCDKAGGYAVQGAAAVFIESLSGSYSGVMGLPLFETAELLRTAGVAYWRRPIEH
jgi:nucleoside triphosphate pyrophosphatase